MFGEPFGCGLSRLIGTASAVDRIVAAFDLQEALGLTGPGKGIADGFGQRDHIVSGEDHQQRTGRNQVDESARRVFQDRLERAHRDFVARSPRAVGEVITVLIGLQREAFTRPPCAGDVAFSAFDVMADAFLNGELL